MLFFQLQMDFCLFSEDVAAIYAAGKGASQRSDVWTKWCGRVESEAIVISNLWKHLGLCDDRIYFKEVCLLKC